MRRPSDILTDILTVARKEWKETFAWSSGRRNTLYRLLLIVGFAGVFFPWQSGLAWVTSPLVLIFSPYVAFFLVISVVADSFAGERERHTLETLLLTRLPDQAIFLGKATGSLGFGWVVAILSIVTGLVTVNLTAGRGEFLGYSAPVWLGSLALSRLGAGLAAGTAVLLSLRAATVKRAQQNMALVTLIILFQYSVCDCCRPACGKPSRAAPCGPAAWRFCWSRAAVLLVANLCLLAAGLGTFKRHRVIGR